jgi:hypothetical protein
VNNLNLFIRLLALFPVFCGATFTANANGLPLQSNVYRMGSGYIQVAVKGKRLCYSGSSSRGSTVASVTPDSQLNGFYRINGWSDTVLYQQDIDTLLFGSVDELIAYEADYDVPRDVNSILQHCLDSSSPFFRQTSSTR